MKSIKCNMDRNGRIAIPPIIRKKLNLKEGDSVLINLFEDNITLTNPYNIEKAQNIIAKYGKANLLNEFLKYASFELIEYRI